MANTTHRITQQELKQFTNIQLKIWTLAIRDADFSKITPEDARIGVEFYEEHFKKKLFKSQFMKLISRGTHWQGLINDLNSSAYQIIKQVLNKTSHEYLTVNYVGWKSAKRSEIEMRLYS